MENIVSGAAGLLQRSAKKEISKKETPPVSTVDKSVKLKNKIENDNVHPSMPSDQKQLSVKKTRKRSERKAKIATLPMKTEHEPKKENKPINDVNDKL